jgi:hypothetical protein
MDVRDLPNAMIATRVATPRNAMRRRAIHMAGTCALGALLALAGCGRNNGGGVQLQPSYSLGGTVSGLSGAGLVLADNNTQTLAVNAGATTFTFGSELNSGTAYAVTVQTQPAGQTCTVANGVGTVTTANVANAVVTCAAQTYPLGGTISGLTTSGLVLANGSATVTLAANATSFQLPAVTAGSSYTVTVATQPAGLACAVAGGTGTARAAVNDVAVTCTDQNFSIGGTITGLTTSGLILANGNDTLTVAANAASFTLPTAVAYGSSYAVTVKTQPMGLTCTVSGGSGTMAAANVTNVVVTCASQSYQLGGSIGGLTASGLVLANGSDTLTVMPGATSFTLPTPVAVGSSYAVIVQTQPTGLTCTVSGGSGTMPANNVVSVSVVCGVTTYTVGGSVSGLTTTGLVLANGSDTLAVMANSTQFTMPSGLPAGAPFAVTVQTQPSAEICSVSNGSGAIAVGSGAANVTSVQVICAAPTVVTFTIPGSASFTVPPGVTSLQIVATGGGGGSGNDSGGGSGGVVSATLAVTSGEILELFVGGGGSSGPSGGGGGGATTVDDSSDTLVAGGGGGGNDGVGGNGGDAASVANSPQANGGNGSGGGGVGGSGGSGGMGAGSAGHGGSGGDGGTGGNGGGGSGGVGGVGGVAGAGFGGAGASSGGGGGGSGYGGGGGGGAGGGGGGGSASLGAAVPSFSVGNNGGVGGGAGGNGSITITYQAPPPP